MEILGFQLELGVVYLDEILINGITFTGVIFKTSEIVPNQIYLDIIDHKSSYLFSYIPLNDIKSIGR